MTKHEDNSILEGLKLEKRRLDLAGFMRWRKGTATYTVRTLPSDRRVEKRFAVRLQSGKVLDLDGRFLCDFLFVNRGAGGVRISLAQRIALPKKIWLYEDLTQTCRRAEVVGKTTILLAVGLKRVKLRSMNACCGVSEQNTMHHGEEQQS